MPEMDKLSLSGTTETLLVTLYIWAMESQRPDAIMNDEKAGAIMSRMSYNISRVSQIPIMDGNRLMRIMITREIDC